MCTFPMLWSALLLSNNQLVYLIETEGPTVGDAEYYPPENHPPR